MTTYLVALWLGANPCSPFAPALAPTQPPVQTILATGQLGDGSMFVVDQLPSGEERLLRAEVFARELRVTSVSSGRNTLHFAARLMLRRQGEVLWAAEQPLQPAPLMIAELVDWHVVAPIELAQEWVLKSKQAGWLILGTGQTGQTRLFAGKNGLMTEQPVVGRGVSLGGHTSVSFELDGRLLKLELELLTYRDLPPTLWLGTRRLEVLSRQAPPAGLRFECLTPLAAWWP